MDVHVGRQVAIAVHTGHSRRGAVAIARAILVDAAVILRWQHAVRMHRREEILHRAERL